MASRFKKSNIKPKEERINETVENLTIWMKRYPKASPMHKNIPKNILRQYSKTEEEYEKLVEEYISLQKDYIYAQHKKWEGCFTEEQERKCKEANLGGVFGYSTRIEELAKKYRSKRKRYYLYNK